MLLNVGALLGYLRFGPLARRWGRRPAFAFMCLGSLLMPPGFLVTALGGYGRAASTIALVYLLGLFIWPFAPETKGRPLPE